MTFGIKRKFLIGLGFYLAGVGSAVVLCIAGTDVYLFTHHSGLFGDSVSKSGALTATVTVSTNVPVPAASLTRLTADQLAALLSSLDNEQQAALRQLFASGMAVDLDFDRTSDNGSTVSDTIRIRNGKVAKNVEMMITNVSIPDDGGLRMAGDGEKGFDEFLKKLEAFKESRKSDGKSSDKNTTTPPDSNSGNH